MKRTILLAYIFASCAIYSDCGAEQQEPIGNFKNPAAVKEVLSGKRTVANAAWWGFNEGDSTAALQAAIDSPASTVIVPYMGKDWIVRPLRLRSNLELIFDPGVVVTAKKGEFKGKGDCLFIALGKVNITLQGYGATLRMRKSDYMGPNYQQGQWRHVLSIRSCSNVKVLGLTLRDSGGDGIYLGVKPGTVVPCKNILVKDCILDNNYRQGMSVTSAENLYVGDCLFKNTSGHAPGAGIDLEPNSAKGRLVNVVISECVSENNNGPGFVVSLRKLSSKSQDVSILFVNCYVKSSKKAGIALGATPDNGLSGTVEFRNCTVQDTGSSGLYIGNKPSAKVSLRFVNCKLQNVAMKPIYPTLSTAVPIYFSLEQSYPKAFDSIEFTNCYVYDNKNRPFLAVTNREISFSVSNVKGDINVCNLSGASMDWGAIKHPIGLKVNAFLPLKQ